MKNLKKRIVTGLAGILLATTPMRAESEEPESQETIEEILSKKYSFADFICSKPESQITLEKKELIRADLSSYGVELPPPFSFEETFISPHDPERPSYFITFFERPKNRVQELCSTDSTYYFPQTIEYGIQELWKATRVNHEGILFVDKEKESMSKLAQKQFGTDTSEEDFLEYHTNKKNKDSVIANIILHAQRHEKDKLRSNDSSPGVLKEERAMLDELINGQLPFYSLASIIGTTKVRPDGIGQFTTAGINIRTFFNSKMDEMGIPVYDKVYDVNGTGFTQFQYAELSEDQIRNIASKYAIQIESEDLLAR